MKPIRGESMEGRRILNRLILFFSLGTLLGMSTTAAQETVFGKNKVQYKQFDWYFIQSAHFDVYFDKADEYIADFTADIAESSYSAISKSFRYKITQRHTL